jgi:hypothetical protein
MVVPLLDLFESIVSLFTRPDSLATSSIGDGQPGTDFTSVVQRPRTQAARCFKGSRPPRGSLSFYDLSYAYLSKTIHRFAVSCWSGRKPNAASTRSVVGWCRTILPIVRPTRTSAGPVSLASINRGPAPPYGPIPRPRQTNPKHDTEILRM